MTDEEYIQIVQDACDHEGLRVLTPGLLLAMRKTCEIARRERALANRLGASLERTREIVLGEVNDQ